MKIKLDENLGTRGADILRKAGHDVATVPQEGLTSSSDGKLIEVCRAERRCLVTLDMDFSNPLRFPPSHYSGIAVLRLRSRSVAEDLLDTIRTLAASDRGAGEAVGLSRSAAAERFGRGLTQEGSRALGRGAIRSAASGWGSTSAG